MRPGISQDGDGAGGGATARDSPYRGALAVQVSLRAGGSSTRANSSWEGSPENSGSALHAGRYGREYAAGTCASGLGHLSSRVRPTLAALGQEVLGALDRGAALATGK